MEFVENEEFSVSCATSEQLKPFNANRYSNDSGVDDIDLRPLDITEIHRMPAAGTDQSRPNSLHNNTAGRCSYHTLWSAVLVMINCSCIVLAI